MKKKSINKKLISKKLIVLILIVLSFFILVPKVHASNPTGEELYNLSNTYKYNSSYNPNGARYFLDDSNKTGLKVSQGEPMMTVFTHGLGGNASGWSNDGEGNFAYSGHSLITRLAKIKDCNFYKVKINPFDSSNIYIDDITKEVYNGVEGRKYSSNDVQNITDISKHIIVVFEAKSTNYGNDAVYSEFNYVISKIVYDISKLNDGKLPRMNLIGHSRGGITNMQYALDHPDLVDSIYSLGTQYTGSTTASIDYQYGSPFCKGCEIGEKDIIDKSVYDIYRNRWNNNYDSLYSKINVMAIGSYQTIHNLVESLTTSVSIRYIREFFKSEKNVYLTNLVIKFLIKAIGFAVETNYAHYTNNNLINLISEILAKYDIEGECVTDILQIFFNEIRLNEKFQMSWYNDCLVDYGSQLGYNGAVSIDSNMYRGFKCVTKCFNGGNCNFNYTSEAFPPVVHNLEALDEELGTYILNDISLGNNNSNYEISEVTYKEDGKDTTGLIIHSYLGENESSVLTIPSVINGKKVVGIGDYAFSNNLYGRNNIEKIVIPNTVEYIGKNAFYNSENISSIEFESNSKLTTIKEGAFSNMSSLTNFTIPNNVNQIENRAFNNSSVTSFNIMNSTNFEWTNNVLVNKNVSGKNYVAIYVNPKVESITIPSNVIKLDSYLFSNNKTIKEVDLSNTKYIGDYAFYGSSLEKLENTSKLNEIGEGVFSGSNYSLNSEDGFVVLGNILYKYEGVEEHVEIPEGISQIAVNSFETSLVKNVVIPESIDTISDNAFINSNNLESILFKGNVAPTISNTSFSKDVILYTKEGIINSYRNNFSFVDYIDQLKVKEINISFYDNNCEYVGSTTEYYGSTFDKYVEPESVTGYDFVSWKTECGTIVYKYDYLKYYEDLKLYPIYEKSKYTVNLVNSVNETNGIEITYGEKVEIDIPNKDGYLFLGYYDKEDNGNLIIDSSLNVVWEYVKDVETLYPHYELIEYSVTYKTNEGVFNKEVRTSFNVENPINVGDISDISKFGYVLDEWRLNGETFESTKNVYKNIVLYAVWIGKLYKINKMESTVVSASDSKVVIYNLVDVSNYETPTQFTISKKYLL